MVQPHREERLAIGCYQPPVIAAFAEREKNPPVQLVSASFSDACVLLGSPVIKPVPIASPLFRKCRRVWGCIIIPYAINRALAILYI